MITLPTEDHRQSLERFGSDPKASWNRKRLFSKIITIIPKEFYQDLAELYIAQDKKDLDDFYDYFVATPSVAAAIKKNQEISDKEYDLTESKEFEKRRKLHVLKKSINNFLVMMIQMMNTLESCHNKDLNLGLN